MELGELQTALKLIEQGDLYLASNHPDGYPGLNDNFLARLVLESIERQKESLDE